MMFNINLGKQKANLLIKNSMSTLFGGVSGQELGVRIIVLCCLSESKYEIERGINYKNNQMINLIFILNRKLLSGILISKGKKIM